MGTELSSLVASHIRDIPDFPQVGVMFKDITPLLADPTGFAATIDYFTNWVKALDVDLVVGIEARGFILAAPAAIGAGLGFVPLRKPGKLPHKTLRESYALEYGEASLEMHEDAIRPHARVVIMDDILATGGTAAAAADLLERAGAEVVAMGFLLELTQLGGAEKLAGRSLEVLVKV